VRGVRWRLGRFQDWWRESIDARIVAGLIAALVLLGAGFYSAKRISSADASTLGTVRITTRLPVTETINGRKVVRYRRKVVYAKASTSYRTQTIRTPSGTKLVTRPVVRYRVIYRKKVVTRNGQTKTVLQPVTTTSQLTNTDLVTTTVVSKQTTTRTVTQPVTVTTTKEVTTTVVHGTTETVTVPVTTTVVSTETDTLPVTITVTLPTTAGDLSAP
jgi:hypothetical protein